jgi:hypothetical protein
VPGKEMATELEDDVDEKGNEEHWLSSISGK